MSRGVLFELFGARVSLEGGDVGKYILKLLIVIQQVEVLPGKGVVGRPEARLARVG
jgi:hypothetical protein